VFASANPLKRFEISVSLCKPKDWVYLKVTGQKVASFSVMTPVFRIPSIFVLKSPKREDRNRDSSVHKTSHLGSIHCGAVFKL